jgi:hypothetical protein
VLLSKEVPSISQAIASYIQTHGFFAFDFLCSTQPVRCHELARLVFLGASHIAGRGAHTQVNFLVILVKPIHGCNSLLLCDDDLGNRAGLAVEKKSRSR